MSLYIALFHILTGNKCLFNSKPFKLMSTIFDDVSAENGDNDDVIEETEQIVTLHVTPLKSAAASKEGLNGGKI